MSSVNTGARWWEGYLVRYLVGSLVGSGAIFVLVGEIVWEGDPVKYKQFIVNYLIGKDASAVLVTVFAVFGFVYCYLASTPITVIHATRAIKGFPNSFARYLWIITGCLAVAVMLCNKYISQNFILFVLAIPAMWMVIAQWACVLQLLDIPKSGFVRFWTRISKYNDFQNYYISLAKNRDSTEKRKELRESYTHLREHSNSVFIVVIELSLLSLLVFVHRTFSLGVRDFILLIGAFTFLWLVPNVFLWGRANQLERLIQENKDGLG